jgi:hypothetical protein
MAYVKFENGLQEVHISNSVGTGGANLKDDVIVVQAMLKYALRENSYFRGSIFTEPDGVIASDTEAVIKLYQHYLRKIRGIRVSADGRIDPTKDRPAYGKCGIWTMQQLSGDAFERWLINNAPNYNWVYDMYLMFPAVRQAIPDPPVGTLNMPVAGLSGRQAVTPIFGGATGQ